MATLGQRLRDEREKRGLSIDELAAQTRINAQHFLAIENDDIASLPGGFFYRSFVRQYARLLDLPASTYQAELDRSLESETATAATLETALPDRQLKLPPLPTGRPAALAETRLWLIRLGALALVIVVCSGVYTFWQRYQQRREDAAQITTQKPAPRQSPPAPAATAQTPPPTTQPVPTPAGQPIVDSQPATASEGGVQLIVQASELSWVGVWRGERLLFGELLQAGERRGFGAPERLRARFGNAGGVEVTWNGQQIPPLGSRGQVRNVEFRADGYTVILPVPKPPADPSANPPMP